MCECVCVSVFMCERFNPSHVDTVVIQVESRFHLDLPWMEVYMNHHSNHSVEL